MAGAPCLALACKAQFGEMLRNFFFVYVMARNVNLYVFFYNFVSCKKSTVNQVFNNY